MEQCCDIEDSYLKRKEQKIETIDDHYSSISIRNKNVSV